MNDEYLFLQRSPGRSLILGANKSGLFVDFGPGGRWVSKPSERSFHLGGLAYAEARKARKRP